MNRVLDKSILLLFATLFAIQTVESNVPVVAFLLGIFTIAVTQMIHKPLLFYGLLVVIGALGIYEPVFLLLLPLIYYESMYYSISYYLYVALLSISFIYPFVQNSPFAFLISLFVLTVASILMGRNSKKLQDTKMQLIALRDTSAERNMLLNKINKEILDKQDNEIHMATLRERNRIARDIHDSVGHMLSRAILQTAALMAMYRGEDRFKESLGGLQTTLNQAMDSVRESVHDMHNDSIDLRQVLSDLCVPLSSNYQIRFEYDVDGDMDQERKYCFVSIVKEALANTVKHSNARNISIVLREQPAFYQLTYEDDGTTAPKDFVFDPVGDTSGIGLRNMYHRVDKLQGIFRIQTTKGFRIFVSINKDVTDRKGMQ